MSDDQTVRQFIELRARGLTFAAISAQLNIPKSTLIDWSKHHQHTIHNLRTVQWEEFLDQTLASRQQRLQSLASQLKLLEAELSSRQLQTVPTHRLFLLAERLRKQIERLSPALHFNAPCQMSNDAVQSWQP